MNVCFGMEALLLSILYSTPSVCSSSLVSDHLSLVCSVPTASVCLVRVRSSIGTAQVEETVIGEVATVEKSGIDGTKGASSRG
jgi:hypothetical protein